MFLVFLTTSLQYFSTTIQYFIQQKCQIIHYGERSYLSSQSSPEMKKNICVPFHNHGEKKMVFMILYDSIDEMFWEFAE